MVLVARPDDSVYDTLGVKRSASLDEVRTQFLKRAKDLHPDVNPAQDAAEQFRRLVSAFETIISFAASSESSDDDAEEAWGAGASSAWQRPAGSRRAAEADTPEASDRRRARWRQTLFEEMYREHMPFGYVNVAERQAAFVRELEDAVRAFAGRGAAEPSHDADADDEASEEARLRSCANREVLLAEQVDLRLSLSLLRQRMRSLDEQAERAEAKAAMWRGAAPASEADRLQAMQRELDYLELARRLRGRVAAQRLEAERCGRLERVVRDRLEATAQQSYASGFA